MKVLLAVKTKAAPGNKEASDGMKYYAMLQGEKEDTVELVKVNAKEERIEIINSGTPMTLTMKKNGFEGKAPPAAAAGTLRPGGVNRVIPGGPPGQAGIPDGGSGAMVGGAAAPAQKQFTLGTPAPAQPVYSPQMDIPASSRYGGGGSVLTGGGVAPQPVAAPAQATMTVPLMGQGRNLGNANSLPPNSTPAPVTEAPQTGLGMPPMPGSHPE
jgi:hypothetical protein